MGRCQQCGEVPLATVYQGPMSEVEIETEFEVTAVNDSKSDFLLRLSRLTPEYNVVQLRRMEVSKGSRRVVPLGIRTNTIDLPNYMERVKELGLTVEIQPAH